MPNDRWVICCDDTPERLFWSNDWGWTALSEATLFDEEEKESLSLPMGGYWQKFEDAETAEEH